MVTIAHGVGEGGYAVAVFVVEGGDDAGGGESSNVLAGTTYDEVTSRLHKRVSGARHCNSAP